MRHRYNCKVRVENGQNKEVIKIYCGMEDQNAGCMQ